MYEREKPLSKKRLQEAKNMYNLEFLIQEPYFVFYTHTLNFFFWVLAAADVLGSFILA